MSDYGPLYLIFALALLYAPFIAASGRRGGGVWKFLSLFCSTVALFSAFEYSAVLGVIVWTFAWVFAGVALFNSTWLARGEAQIAVETATLRAMQEQNELLRGHQDLPGGHGLSPARHV